MFTVTVTTSSLHQSIHALADRFTAAFPPTLSGPRTVGREAEYPVVTATGVCADVRRLWPLLLADGDLTPQYGARQQSAWSPATGRREQTEMIVGLTGIDFSYALEVGVGTVEINTRPCTDLLTLQAIHERALRRLVRAATRHGWLVLGYGIQPVSPPSLRLMTPKPRYLSLYRAMGDAWLWYTVTASDQLHVAICEREMMQLLNYGNMIAPLLIALCGNSPIYRGRPSRFCSAREGRMAQILTQEERHGLPRRPYTSMADYIERIAQATYLIQKADGDVVPSSYPFTAHLEAHGADYDAFLFHEHYVWNSARLRSAYGTVEIRPACQQPGREQMAAAALMLGLIEAVEPIFAYITHALSVNYWDEMRHFHEQAIAVGLAAPPPQPDFWQQIVTSAEEGLRNRSFGEERLLAPIWQRLARRVNPAQRARQIFAIDGMAGLLRHARISVP